MRETDVTPTQTSPEPTTGQARRPLSRQKPILAMILAMDRNRLIGADGGMPWHVPGELAYFRKVTLGKPVIMGRVTHESIGKPLAGRLNIVVTRDRDWTADGVTVVHALQDAREQARSWALASDPPADELMIIGGAALCREAMPSTERLYLTDIDHVFDGDTWFDSYEPDDWTEVSACSPPADQTGGYRVTYRVLERRKAHCD